MLKRVFAAVVSAAMILCSINVFAADEKVQYIALGDSIAAGYGLKYPDTQSYPALLANANKLTYVNYGVNGLTTTQLIDAIESGQYDISGADVITVSIGSNDLMRPMINTFAAEIGVNPNSENFDKDVIDRIEYLKQNESASQLKARLDRLEAKLVNNPELLAICDNTSQVMIPKVAETIRAKNPKCQLIFTNYYNPYKNKILVVPMSGSAQGEYPIGARVQTYIDRLNGGLAESDDYKIADVYGNFTTARYINANVDMRTAGVSFDPHPTALGHRAIYLAVADVYDPLPEFMYGDANGDGQLDASDAAETMQKVLTENYKLGLEKKTSDWKKYVDVDANGFVDASDAADILQKVLQDKYRFVVEK
ncbi:MAG: hypothetical protein IJ062_08350 [Firmicutes bacterium]|nr:hypothetical protein [Bacillota bacterium]